jgi:hypothetical protein
MIELMNENLIIRALILGACMATIIALNKPKQR